MMLLQCGDQTENGMEAGIVGPVRCGRDDIADGSECYEEEVHGEVSISADVPFDNPILRIPHH